MASAAPGMSLTGSGWVRRWTCSMTVPSRSRKTAGRMPMAVGLSMDLFIIQTTILDVALSLLENFEGSDVLMIALPQPAIHAADEGRQHVEAQVEFVHVGHFMIGRRSQGIDAAVGEIALGLLWLLYEFDDARVLVELGDAASLGVWGAEEEHGHVA